MPDTVTIGAIGYKRIPRASVPSSHFSKIQKLPRYDDMDEVVPVHIMNVSWSADHRGKFSHIDKFSLIRIVIDGGSIANFSNLVKQYLEEPAR